MLRPTDTLRSDHALTATGLAVLQAVAREVRSGQPFPADDCAILLRFLREFELAVHLRKEAELICPAVAMRGDDRAAALVGELMRMQEEVAELTHALVLFWEPASELSPGERAGFADTVDALATRILRMQHLEENELFPACDAAVPADDQLEWIEQFARLEAERGGRGVWAARLRKLAATWLV
jgi:hemerythrin-like domain-containing protein